MLTKVKRSGGRITTATCKEQLLYELHRPDWDLTPDVTADFSGVGFRYGSTGLRCGGHRHRRPEKLKVSVGYSDGFVGEGADYAGPGCVSRARLAIEIVKARLAERRIEPDEIRYDCIGLDAILGGARLRAGDPAEVQGPRRGATPDGRDGRRRRERGGDALHERPGGGRRRDEGREARARDGFDPPAPPSRAPGGSLSGGDPVKLRDIAHSRTGDKGNIANVSVIAFDERDYGRLVESVTAERVKTLLVGIVEGDVVRYEMPAVCALNFVMPRSAAA